MKIQATTMPAMIQGGSESQSGPRATMATTPIRESTTPSRTRSISTTAVASPILSPVR